MAAKKSAEWSCKNCDGITSEEPKWWPTIEPTSKFETSVGVCAPCFRLLNSQVKYDNVSTKKTTAKKATTKKASKKTAKKSTKKTAKKSK